jgi:hypothetical protein
MSAMVLSLDQARARVLRKALREWQLERLGEVTNKDDKIVAELEADLSRLIIRFGGKLED